MVAGRGPWRAVANVVDATGIVKRWGSTPVLSGATFTIGHGITGLLGANGAGKTTVLGMVLGLHHPNDGQISVLGLDPALVLLDEPTDGLDPVQREHMLSLIRRVGTDFGIDIILSSHLLEEVERVCDGVVILSGGQVAAAGGLDTLTGVTGGLIV